MSFKDFSLADAVHKLGLTLAERTLFAAVKEQAPSAWLTETLKETVPLALSLGNEKARSEMIIAPVLIEVRRSLGHRVSLYSGVELSVDVARGLSGVCDFLFSRSPEQVLLRAPVVAVVEAKQEDIRGALGQCAAEMLAARLFNEREGQAIEAVYGAVTTGDVWRFLCLRGDALVVDTETYFLHQVAKILGIFRAALEPGGGA
ncbi:MAG: hypothetical protein U0359_38305 [Byssovorax sp.]